MAWPLAQTTPDAATIFYISLALIFLTGVITTIATKWMRDKCLKLFDGYHVTLEGLRGSTDWGRFKALSSGIELLYDHPYTDTHGRKKTSLLIYGQEIEPRMLTLFRYHDELTPEKQKVRLEQVRHTFNPGFRRRIGRGIRNMLNTLRDAFGAAIGAAVGQAQRMNPGNVVLSTQASQVTQIGQTILGRAAANAYEPLLEQYIGQPVILEVLDPINPNNVTQQYAGYLADYTQQFIAVLNIDHATSQWIEITLPDVAEGELLPPLAPPPAAGGPAPILPAPAKIENEIAVRIDGRRFRLHNTRSEPVVVRRLEREGYEPLEIGSVIPPNGTMSLPARDARGARVIMEVIRCMDIIAPRKYATVRHAGELVERPGLIEDLGLGHLPLVPALPELVKISRLHGSEPPRNT